MKGFGALAALGIGAIVGIVGAGILVLASLNAGDISISSKVNTQDTAIVKLILMGKNLEEYSEESGNLISNLFFKLGGPNFCGEKVVITNDETIEVSIWKDTTICDYRDLIDASSSYEDKFLENITKQVVESEFRKYSNFWGIIIEYKKDSIFTLKKIGIKAPGIPTVIGIMEFEWKSERDTTEMLEILKTGFGDAEIYEIAGSSCNLHNGTVSYKEEEFTFNIVICN